MSSKRPRNNTDASSTPGSLQRTSGKTSSDNKKISSERSRTTNSSQTLGVASTSKGKGLKAFWTPLSTEWSKRLWSCTVTDCVDLEATSWTPFLQRLTQNSWFTVRQTIPKPTPKSLPTTLLAITTVFVARNNGKRSADNRRRRKLERQTGQGAGKTNTGESPTHSHLPNVTTTANHQGVDRGSSLDVQPVCEFPQ